MSAIITQDAVPHREARRGGAANFAACKGFDDGVRGKRGESRFESLAVKFLSPIFVSHSAARQGV